jgi:hypothetical protein
MKNMLALSITIVIVYTFSSQFGIAFSRASRAFEIEYLSDSFTLDSISPDDSAESPAPHHSPPDDSAESPAPHHSPPDDSAESPAPHHSPPDDSDESPAPHHSPSDDTAKSPAPAISPSAESPQQYATNSRYFDLTLYGEEADRDIDNSYIDE